MNKSTKTKSKNNTLQPLSDFEESLLYMSYRYAIGRHTIHSHAHAGDILRHFYERLKLTPERMQFTSKDMNQSIEDILRFSDVYIDNRNYYNNIFPYELYYIVINKELEKDPEKDVANTFKKIHINVDENNQYVSHTIEYKGEDDSKSYRMLDDLSIWSNVAKILDMSTHHHAKLIDDSICEYVEMPDGMTFRKVVVDRYVKNTYITTYIAEDAIKEIID